MAYFPDGTPVEYSGIERDVRSTPLAIGWLEPPHQFRTGETTVEFQSKLLQLCSAPEIVHRGFHCCQFGSCKSRRYELLEVTRDGQSTYLGHAVIVVEGKSAVYAAPTLIYHYVTAHEYRPPDEFIDAVLSQPKRTTPRWPTIVGVQSMVYAFVYAFMYVRLEERANDWLLQIGIIPNLAIVVAWLYGAAGLLAYKVWARRALQVVSWAALLLGAYSRLTLYWSVPSIDLTLLGALVQLFLLAWPVFLLVFLSRHRLYESREQEFWYSRERQRRQ